MHKIVSHHHLLFLLIEFSANSPLEANKNSYIDVSPF